MNEIWDEAVKNFVVTNHWTQGKTTWVRAEARTGSGYTIVLTRLPEGVGTTEGGDHMISLLRPRTSNMVYTVFPGEKIAADYVAEKLCPDMQHPGDRAAVWMAVNAAISFATEANAL